MDDLLVCADEKRLLWEVAADVGEFLRRELALRLKASVTAVMPTSEGVPWLGMRVFAGTIRLQRDGRTRFAAKLRDSKRAWQVDADEAHARASAASLCGHLKHASCMALRRSIMDRLF